MKPSILSFVEEHRISNVIFKPYQPRSRLGPLIRMGDVHLVLMMPGYEGIILPSKLYGILASARPAIFVGPTGSEVARVIREERCGFVVPNGDDARLVEVIESLRRDRSERLALGTRGRMALERKYSKQLACAAWHEVLHSGLHDRAGDRDRYRQIAAQHVAGITSGFLTSLGLDFMAVLYRAIDENPNCFLHVETRQGRVVGFVAGTSGRGSLLRGLLSHLPSAIWSLRGSLVRPSRLLGMVRLARHLRGSSDTSDAGGRRAELLSIAVAEEARGTGVAERLYRRLETDFHRLGIHSFRIVVGSNLATARRFYARMGAREAGETKVHAGHDATLYEAEVRKPSEEEQQP